MSLQDDFFDVDSALEGKPEHEAFNRIWKRLCETEKQLEGAFSLVSAIANGLRALRKIERSTK